MTTPQVQNDPVTNLPSLYINGLTISNDATTPNTVLDISAGIARDSNNIMDITLGSSNIEGNTVSAPLLINSGVNGINGLDTGTVAASTMYAIYVIADSRYYNPTAGIMSLSLSGPKMPFGYDSYRLIGYWPTDSSSHFVVGYISNNIGSFRQFVYDVPQATAVTAGHATTYTNLSLSPFVPTINNLIVSTYSVYTPNAASDTLKLKGCNAVGDAYTFVGQVASVNISCFANILSQIQSISLLPEMSYKVSSSSDAVAIYVLGYNFSL